MGDGNPVRGYMPSDQSAHSYSSGAQTSTEGPEQRRSSMEFERGPFQHHGYGHPHGTSPFNLQALGAALPNYSPASTPFAQQQSLQQHYPQTAPQGVLYQVPQLAPFAGQPGASPGQYGPQFNPQQFSQHYQHVNQPRSGVSGYAGTGTSPQSRMFPQNYPPPQQQLQRPQAAYPAAYSQTGQHFVNAQQGQGYPRGSPYGYTPGHGAQSHYMLNTQQSPSMQLGSGSDTSLHLHPESNQAVSRQSSASSLGPSAPRGPPPKPKQSGHALWIGNLPPSTTIFDLKDHFSQGATEDIESVFLISKSNCAFANYKSETACAAAMQRFNDTRFLGAKLVCRLRRLNPAPAASSGSRPPSARSGEPAVEESQKDVVSPDPQEQTTAPEEVESVQPQEPQPKVKEKFFIIKSLTIEDLELSARNGVWATQSHNETTLNSAFAAAENVYLIFSANKSGEYFGYARMLSPISEESAATIDFTPRNPSLAGPEPDLPNKIPTPASQHAPKGYVIDDSARGTIFWEAELLNNLPDGTEELATEGDFNPLEQSKARMQEIEEPTSESQSFGKPFRIDWVSTDRLPFYRTRGLRNPWNSNREVKIARDGTELEPSVGRRLVSMFHRPQIPTGAGNPSQGPSQPQAGYGMAPFMGYAPAAPSQQYYHGH